FWAEYPNHQNEAAARREWLRSRPTRPPTQELRRGLAGMNTRLAFDSDARRYVPTAAAYLADRRWRDADASMGRRSTRSGTASMTAELRAMEDAAWAEA